MRASSGNDDPSVARLRDVAERAGVSTASVSRVLNRPETVSPKTRQRIEAAIAEMNFVPNWAARSLASQKSRTVGAVVPTLGIAIFARGIEALQNRLEQSGHGLLLASAQYDAAKEIEQVRTLIERNVEALVLVGNEHDDEIFELVDRADIPLVTTYLHAADSRFASVGVDNKAASRRIIQHLVELGHREIGVVTSPTGRNDRTRSRLEGMMEGLAQAGIPVPAKRVLEVPYSIADGRRATRMILAQNRAVTAIVCTTDVLAIGAVLEAPQLGRQVPGDLSVTGFDDLDLSSQLTPALTTIHVPADEIGRQTADLILSRLRKRPGLAHIELPAELILRQSTTTAPKNLLRTRDLDRAPSGR